MQYRTQQLGSNISQSKSLCDRACQWFLSDNTLSLSFVWKQSEDIHWKINWLEWATCKVLYQQYNIKAI